MSDEPIFYTTQPGWAFATLAELRALGVEERAELWHRDSTLVLPPSPDLRRRQLLTVAEAYDGVAVATARGQWDATRALAQRVEQVDLRSALGRHGRARGRGSRMGPEPVLYVVVSEVWGDTQLRRRELASVMRRAVRTVFPTWREPSEEPTVRARSAERAARPTVALARRPGRTRDARAAGAGQGEAPLVRLLCKADLQAAVVGVQRYSRVGPEDESRPGALREHLACGLLALAGVRAGDAVLDPFMGSGTILRAAADHYGAGLCGGAEVDRLPFRVAQQRIEAAAAARADDVLEVDLLHGAFDSLDLSRLPEGVRMVSNLPFGVTFQAVETARLVRFLVQVRRKAAAMALLMSREQAAEVGQALSLRVKHVLVLGQPAAIVYGQPPRGPAGPAGHRTR